MWSECAVKKCIESRGYLYFIPDDSNIWSGIFSAKLFGLRKRKKGWIFKNYVRTDGVSLCTTFANELLAKCQKTFYKKRCDCSECRVVEHCKTGYHGKKLTDTRLIAIDPGLINIFFGVEVMPDGSVRTFKYRNKEYYRDGRVYDANRISKKYMKRCSVAIEAMSSTVSKTVRYDTQLAYWTTCAIHNQLLWTRLATVIRSKMSMETFRHRLSALDNFIFHHVANGSDPKKVLVAYGSGCVKGGFARKGTLSAPTSKAFKRVRRMFPVMLIDEAFTSQKCPYCKEQLHDKKVPYTSKKTGKKGVKTVRSVKLCKSQQCVERAMNCSSIPQQKIAVEKKVYEISRDKVGGLNIHECARWTLDGKDGRPPQFVRVVRQKKTLRGSLKGGTRRVRSKE